MSIKLSLNHGLNPSIIICTICGKDTSIALFGRLKGDKEAPKEVKGDLCDECKKKYIQIIEVESKTNREPTGRYTYILKEGINVNCPKGIAIMEKEEFTKLFCK